MSAAILVGVIVLIVVGVLIARAVAARADGRSIARHEQVLGTLGKVSGKSDHVAPVVTLSERDVARPHVRVASDDEVSPRPMARPEIPSRIRLDVEPAAHTAIPVFGDSTEVAATPATSTLHKHRSRRRHFISRSAGDGPGPDRGGDAGDAAAASETRLAVPAREESARAAARSIHRQTKGMLIGVGSTAALALVGLFAWQLSDRHTTPQASAGPHHRPSAPRVTPKPSAPTPTVVLPTSVTQAVVVYKAPTKTYTLSFHASATCWIGIERQVNGAYLYMKTLSSSSATYVARGPIVVRIGNPAALSMTVDGVKVALPSANVNPYDAKFA
jgi:hypothetical protein